jgi:hypothetical protein
MEEPTEEKWLELCKAATGEHDLQKLLQLTDEINCLLDKEDEGSRRI